MSRNHREEAATRSTVVHPPETLPPTDVRFSLRGFLLLMGGVAVAAALYGSLLRQLPESASGSAIVVMAVIGVSLTGCFFYVARTRHCVERRAGVPRFVLAHHSYLFPRAPRLAATLLGITALVYGLGMLALIPILLSDEKLRSSSLSFAWNGVYAVLAVAFGISTLWWNRNARLCEDGVLVRNRLVPWSENSRHYWDACHKDVLVFEWQKCNRVALRVPPVDHDAVAEYVAERIATAKAQPLATPK
jgi:hypothetical protein